MKAVLTGHTHGLGEALAATLRARGIPVLGLARGRSPQPDDDGFTQIALDLADAAALARALMQLPEATRSVLWLYHAEGYTHEEIAALMARTPSFSKSQLARGGRRLRALLESTAEKVHA